MPLRIILVGPPNAGKGTLAEAVVRHYGVVHLSTGSLLRDEVEAGTGLGNTVKSIMGSGQLVPDAIMVDLVMKSLHEREDVRSKGVLLDGFPRTKTQAEKLVSAGVRIDLLVVLEVDRAVLKERCLGRRVDPQTGLTYHTRFNPPPPDIAARCVTRSDDTEERLETRIRIFERERDDLLAVFKDETIVLDANRNMNQVFADFNEQLTERLKRGHRMVASSNLRTRKHANSKI